MVSEPSWRGHAVRGPPTAATTSRSAPNLIERNFSAAAPNWIWLADITYVETDQGWLYLATVLDLYSRRIVGWAMEDHLRADLPLALNGWPSRWARPGAGLIHHSDRGVQYASGEDRQAGDTKSPASRHR